MKSPWGESNYSDSGNNNNNDDRTSSFITSHGFLGSLIERSTSAPPLSSEGGLSFGDAGSSVSLPDFLVLLLVLLIFGNDLESFCTLNVLCCLVNIRK